MAIKREIIDGTKILNEIESSNITRTEYDTATKKMIAEFKNGVRYEYEDVPHATYTNAQGKAVVQLDTVVLGGPNGLNA